MIRTYAVASSAFDANEFMAMMDTLDDAVRFPIMDAHIDDEYIVDKNPDTDGISHKHFVTRRVDGMRFMVKYETGPNDARSEVFASMVAPLFGLRYAGVSIYTGFGWCAECHRLRGMGRLATIHALVNIDESVAYTHMAEFTSNGNDDVARTLVIDEIRMRFMDAVIGNEDRHEYNSLVDVDGHILPIDMAYSAELENPIDESMTWRYAIPVHPMELETLTPDDIYIIMDDMRRARTIVAHYGLDAYIPWADAFRIIETGFIPCLARDIIDTVIVHDFADANAFRRWRRWAEKNAKVTI